MNYIGNCTQLPAGEISKMVENAKETSYNAIYSRLGVYTLKAVFPYYNWSRSPYGLKLSKDYAVRYYRSIYQGMKCYFIVHSAIEYVFV